MRPTERSLFRAAIEGAYGAERAAALSGVPKSTLYEWARKGVLTPSVSPEREKLWSYADLMDLRIIYWLRQRKRIAVEGVPATSMTRVRETLAKMEASGLALWTVDRDQVPASRVFVDENGNVILHQDEGMKELSGQYLLGDAFLDLLGPFIQDGARGPDLRAPRSQLRIIPGKLAGEPHIVSSRISTAAVAGLAAKDYPFTVIRSLYPQVSEVALGEAIELERELRTNVVEAA